MFAIRSLALTASVAAALIVSAGPVAAQNVIGGYQAVIGNADLYNSNGTALSAYWQVIRQDRANYHRFGIQQPGDEWDAWFGSAEMRGALERWVQNGGISAAERAQIMSGGATIYVEVLGQGNRATGVRISLGGAGSAAGAAPAGSAASAAGAAAADGTAPAANDLVIEIE